MEPDRTDSLITAIDALLKQELRLSDALAGRALETHDELVRGIVASDTLVRTTLDAVRLTLQAAAPVTYSPPVHLDRELPGGPLTGPSEGPPTGPSIRTRQDLLIGAIVFLYVCMAYISLTTWPLPESLVAPLAEAFGFLLWVYDRQG